MRRVRPVGRASGPALDVDEPAAYRPVTHILTQTTAPTVHPASLQEVTAPLR